MENISVDENGCVAVGPASGDEWKGQELDFLPPELYWNGRRTPASDVYSIGLLLYYAVTGGKLPFEGTCRDPQLRRMSGDPFDIPPEAGRRLGEIIEKATRFKAPERYQSMEEMRVMAESCLKNLYLNGPSNAETLFRKSDDDLTELEKLMVGIIEKEEDTPIPVPPETHFEEEPEDEEPPETEEEPESPAAPEEEPEIFIPEFRYEEEDPGLKPVIINRKGGISTVPYSNETEKDRRSAEAIKRRRRRPVAVILVLCAILVIASILFNALMNDLRDETLVTLQAAEELQRTGSAAYDDEEEPAASAVNPTEPVVDDENILDIPPEPSEEPYIPGQEPSEPSESAIPVEHGYQLIVKDVSWTEAKAECEAMGGHLVVINDAEEFGEVAALADQYGMQKVWVGGHRENGVMLWEDGSAQVYEKWSKGEPSYIDSGDNVPEDYVMMWFNRGWAFNDSRNDPCRDYPNMYSGKICYICEVGG